MRINYKTKELLTDEEVQSKDIKYAVENTKLQLQSDILATQQDLEDNRELLYTVKTTYPLDIQHVIDLQIEIENLEKGLEILTDLQKEFGW